MEVSTGALAAFTPISPVPIQMQIFHKYPSHFPPYYPVGTNRREPFPFRERRNMIKELNNLPKALALNPSILPGNLGDILNALSGHCWEGH